MVKKEIDSFKSTTLTPTSTLTMLLNNEFRNVRKIGEQCEYIDKMKEDQIPVHQNGWRNQWLRQRWTIFTCIMSPYTLDRQIYLSDFNFEYVVT